MGARILWITGRPGSEIKSREVVLDGISEWTLGRHPECEVVLDQPIVSSRHARLRASDDGLTIEDLGSRNGTFVIRGGEEIKLEAGHTEAVGVDDSIRVGPFVVAMAERLGDGVHLSTSMLPDSGTLETMVVPTSPPHDEDEVEESPRLARALVEALAPGPRRGAFQRSLEALRALSGARRAFLLECGTRGFVLRASSGVDGPACLSQSFLEATAKRSGAWAIVPRTDRATELAGSRSILAYDVGVRLYGIPFFGRRNAVTAVACLELDGSEAGVSNETLDLFARTVGPSLDDLQTLDRETRRREAAEKRASRAKGEDDNDGDAHDPDLPVLIGTSRAFCEVVAAVERAAPTGATLLIRGPSGSGKEGLARLAHVKSDRREAPFVALNCASIAETLAESELFGHVRGAFTGADRERQGAFERADGGTIFLDEVGELPASLQAKLLRVLESGEFERVGGTTKRADVRVVSATHRDLEERVRQGTFREDLFYRLRVIDVELPPLCERAEDIAALTEHFVRIFSKSAARSVSGISARAARSLSHYSWPGNVRELRNVIERAIVLDTDGMIDVDDLPADIAGSFDRADAPASDLLEDILNRPWDAAKAKLDAVYFQRALDATNGRVGEAAKATGITRRALSKKIKDYGLKTKRD